MGPDLPSMGQHRTWSWVWCLRLPCFWLESKRNSYERQFCKLSYFLWRVLGAYVTVLSGIDENDGNERMVTVVVMVLQVFRLYADCCGYSDHRFPYRRWRRSSSLNELRSQRHLRVSAAVFTFSYDILLRHHDILLKRYVVGYAVSIGGKGWVKTGAPERFGKWYAKSGYLRGRKAQCGPGAKPLRRLK